MKKVGSLLLAVCMWGAPVMATSLQVAVEREVLSQEQEQYATRQRFEMAVERFQFFAKYNERDEDGFVKETFDLAQAYYNAVQGHSQLYAIELYGYMNRRMERPWKWEDRTIASYVLKALKKKSKRVEFSQQSQYTKISNILLPIHKKRHSYFPLVWEIAMARRTLLTLEMDAQVARGEVGLEALTPQQVRQITSALERLERVGESLVQAKPELLKVVVEGLQHDPLLLQSTPLNLEQFLVHYGMYSLNQTDGTTFVKAGKQMLELGTN